MATFATWSLGNSGFQPCNLQVNPNRAGPALSAINPIVNGSQTKHVEAITTAPPQEQPEGNVSLR